MTDHPKECSNLRFIFPLDGDFLSTGDGIPTDGGLFLTVRILAESGCKITVSGTPCEEKEGEYRARIFIPKGYRKISARCEDDGTEKSVSVYCLSYREGGYRISSDDNILFLADITYNKDIYTSIFDNPYLAVYKKAHDLYGAKVHLNVFYEFDSEAAKLFSSPRPYFNLSMMTDKFKDEWRENAGWLRLSFHARSEMPDKPYKNASAITILEDYRDVKGEVIRFAGEEVFSEDVTTIHWGEASPECVRALRSEGLEALTGYFELDGEGEPLVAYYAPIPLICHVGERDFYRDSEMGITFGRIDRVTNIGTLDEIMSDLENIISHPTRSPFVSIMIHEQYFESDYFKHLPDFEERVLGPARLLHEKGYTGMLLREALKESL